MISSLIPPALFLGRSMQHSLIALASVAVLLHASHVSADDEDAPQFSELSLQDAMDHARKSATSRRSVLDVAASQATLDQLRGQESWSLGINMETSDEGQVSMSSVPVDTTVELRKILPTGGTIAMGGTVQHIFNPVDEAQTVEVANSNTTVDGTLASVRFNQPILRGLKWNNVAQRRLARRQLRERQEAHRVAQNDILLAVATA